MDWKEFFKPTKSKIILPFIIPIYLTYTIQYQMAIPPAKSIWWEWIILPIPLIFFYSVSIYGFLRGSINAHPIFSRQEEYLLFITNYILPILINYIVVCFIFYIYKKYKK